MSLAGSLESLFGAGRVGEHIARPGAAPVPLALPASEEEISELLRLCARESLRVLPLGLGSKLGWCRPGARADLAISTRELCGITAYEPGDGTVTARAGTRMDALAEAVRAGGHRLTPAVPRPGEATLGGVIAAGQSGFDRLRFGPLRSHVLGTRIALSSGDVAKSGGSLVKNVTGFDLHRLHCGSHGTLGILVAASLRLFPLPEEAALARLSCASLAEALGAARRVLAARPRPVGLWVENLDATERAGWRTAVLFEGREEVVRWEQGAIAELLPGAEWAAGERARRLAAHLRDLEPDARRTASLHVAALPARIEGALRTALAALEERGLAGLALVHPGVATADLSLEALAGDAAAALVRGLRAELEPRGARVAVRGIDWAAARGLDPFGEPSPALPLMHRLRRALDPDGRFAAGRFHGGS